MRAVLEPAVKNQFMAKVIVAHADHEVVFHPDETALEREASRFKRADETRQQPSTWHAGVHASTGFAILRRYGQAVPEQGAGFRF